MFEFYSIEISPYSQTRFKRTLWHKEKTFVITVKRSGREGNYKPKNSMFIVSYTPTTIIEKSNTLDNKNNHTTSTKSKISKNIHQNT
jgi:hypothetical protein